MLTDSKKLATLLLLFVCATGSRAAADVAVSATVEDLAWMTGSWVGQFGEQTLEENWIQPAGGSIACLVRFTGEGGTGMIELIVIEETDATLVLRVRQWLPGFVPRAAEPQVMALAEIGERRVGFITAGPGDFETLAYSRPAPDAFNIDVVTKDGDKFQLNLHPR